MLIQELEKTMFMRLNQKSYLKSVLSINISKDANGNSVESSRIQKRVHGIWGKHESKRGLAVTRALMQMGISDVKRFEGALEFDPEIVSEVVQMNPTDARG